MSNKPEMDTFFYVFDYTVESPDEDHVTSIKTPGPTRWTTLGKIHSRLVLAGGATDRTNATNELWALNDDGKTWDQPFPPMPQVCWGATALSISGESGDYFIIAGGVENNSIYRLNTVQVYNVDSKQWALAQPLPMSCYFMKGVLHNGDWYLAGGRWQYKKIFYASVESLIAMSEGRRKNISGWKMLTDLSQCCSSISVYQNQLIAFGGAMSIFMGPNREIQVYSPGKQLWIKVGCLPMPSGCDSIATTPIPTMDGKEELLLVGGNRGDHNSSFSNIVTKAHVKVVHSLDDCFSLNALGHIQMVSGFEVFHYLICGEMTDRALLQRDDSTGQKPNEALFREWLTGNSKNTKRPATWRVLLEQLRDMEMNEVAQNIEQLFTVSNYVDTYINLCSSNYL